MFYSSYTTTVFTYSALVHYLSQYQENSKQIAKKKCFPVMENLLRLTKSTDTGDSLHKNGRERLFTENFPVSMTIHFFGSYLIITGL